ncbi:MAG: hypothetical protein QM619_16790 [Micropruina sp.]|uniref:hypothetical protein n=1 Tax=Micropruina sp. TaxID=2737536 RepID=UPI0039E509E1
MRTLAAAGRVVRDIVWLTVIQPVRDGHPRSAGWPVGLRPIVASLLALYGLLALAVVFAGALRRVDVLVVTLTGLTIPDVGTWLCLAGLVLSIAVLQTAALHLPWWVKLLSLPTTAGALAFFATAAAIDPMLLVSGLVSLSILVVLTVVRWRSEFAWWEFVVVTLAVAAAVFIPLVGTDLSRGLNRDWRGSAVEGGLISLESLALPALLVAGAALAQISVTASFAAVAAAVRELPRGWLTVAGLLMLGWAAVALADLPRDPDNAGTGWVASALALLLAAAMMFAVLAATGRPPAWSDLDEDPTPLNYLVAIGSSAAVMLILVPTAVREHSRRTGPQWLFDGLVAYTAAATSNLTQTLCLLATGVVGLAVTLPTARRGRPSAAMFLGCVAALAVFRLLRSFGYTVWADNTVPQMSGLLLVALLVTAAVLAIRRRLSPTRVTALASGILLCLVYPHRAILDDPISALLGFSGIGAVLFGLIWRVLTEGDLSRDGTPRWPVPSRVLLYCGSALLGVTTAAFVSLTRSSGSSLDVAIYAVGGDFLLGTPLFLTAGLGCLAIAVAPARRPAR